MKTKFLILFILVSCIAIGQTKIDISKIPHIKYSPQVYVNGVRQGSSISIKELHKYGLEVVLDDKTFKIIQFGITYDCHSRAFFDFSFKIYSGNTVPPKDDYLQKRVWVGDVIDVANVVIERGQERYVMEQKSFRITD
jgi:hypothetical protein